MDFQLTEEQAQLVAAVQSILQDHTDLPQSARLNFFHYDPQLQRHLEENGFLNASRDLGPLAAALVVEEAAKIATVVEAAASALVAPLLLPDESLPGPIALLCGSTLSCAHRNLLVAKTALIDLGDDVAILSVGPGDVVAVPSICAYPYGRFAVEPDLTKARVVRGAGARLRQWWRTALAVEFAGAAQSAVNFTLEHIKQRHAFGRPIGAFQAVQHRMVQCQIVATGVRWLALRAAWSGEPYHADLAACYAQQHVRKLLVDLHQFSGAMGVTNEFLLHFWTYRLRALQSEAGGLDAAAAAIAHHRWSAVP